MPASTENGQAGLTHVPSFVSARSANALISENRPTRIQAETLLVLNALLDELLRSILSSAKSLATDRIKSDGVLKVLNNNLLAKDAVLEAELEFRAYLDGKRAEGAKVPLGLMSTSRLDGTDGFPVQNAYKALRLRCQYCSTLSDYDDDEGAKDHNLMSSDGRPVATVTAGVAIYVTALLEFIGQHILQNVSRVIERDNSDEASLYDLRAAITEDEQLNPLYNKMFIKQEVARRIGALEARQGAHRGLGSEARVVKPWQVPTEGDFDEAAAPTLFSSNRASVQQLPRSDNGSSSASTSSKYGHAASSSLGNTEVSSLRASMSTLRTSSSLANNGADGSTATSPGGGLGKPMGSTSGRIDAISSNTGSFGRRQSSERSWSGVFGSMKRRNSFKQGSENGGTSARLLSATSGSSFPVDKPAEAGMDADDDFEALMMSNQTMKVSLTPNRLHTIEVAKKGDKANLAAVRRRPGTAGIREDSGPAEFVLGRGPSPSPTHSSRIPSGGDPVSSNAAIATERTSTSSGHTSDAAVARPNSRASLQTALRPERRAAAPPPSSYRSPSPALIGKSHLLSREVAEEDMSSEVPLPSPLRPNRPRLQPRDSEGERSSSTAQDLVDLFKSTPPSTTQDRFSNFGSDSGSMTEATSKKSAMGDRVRTLFGRKSTSSTGHGSPTSQTHKSFRTHQRADTKESLEVSHDTYVTSSTTNSMKQSRSLISPTEAPFNRPVASRSPASTSEHPVSMADATEARSTPNVNIIEPESTLPSRTEGLGIGVAAVAGAAGRAAASRSTSNSSRAASYTSHSPSVGEVASQDETVTDDVSSSTKNKAPEELVSRKVPWGYKRNSATILSGERNGTSKADRRRSVGYTSSNASGALPVRVDPSRPASDIGHGSSAAIATSSSAMTHDGTATPPASASATSRASNAPSAWSIPGNAAGTHTLARRGSFGSKPTTANQLRRRSTQLETIQLLADLERAMRNCHTVDECRELVRKAMHSDGASLSPFETRANGVNGDEPAPDQAKVEGDMEVKPGTAPVAAAGGAVLGAAGVAARASDLSAQKPGSENATKSDVTVNGVKEGQIRGLEPNTQIGNTQTSPSGSAQETTSLEKVDQALVVAWLLGGDEDTGLPDVQHVGETSKAPPEDGAVRQASVDSQVSQRDSVGLASSSVVSLHSNYKDAQDEISV